MQVINGLYRGIQAQHIRNAFRAVFWIFKCAICYNPNVTVLKVYVVIRKNPFIAALKTQF